MIKIKNVRLIAVSGLMLAIVIVLSALESMLPPLPFLPPNFRIGLANIVTMYCVICIGKPQAVLINLLKSVFVLLTRGPMAAILSFCGGMLSVFIIIILIIVFKERVSYLAFGIIGAISHNLGQFAALFFILDQGLFIYYLPAMLISGVIMGAITGTFLRVLMPVMKKAVRP